MIFLRPFFLILLFVPVFVWFFFKKTVYRNAWTKVCDPHLLPYLTINVNEKKTKLYTCLMCFVWIIGVLALSGPAFIKKDAVTVSAQSGLAVVVDMSPVTDAKAIQQVVHKLYDIADMKKDTAVGLILADQKAYIALPLTQDKDILKTMASQLKEKNIMPATGQNIPAGIEHAEKLLTQSGFQKGQIIVFIAGIHDTEELKNIVEKSPYTIYFIGVGDMLKAQPVQLENGRFWNEGKLYGLSEIKKEFSSQFTMATIDEQDLKKIFEKQKLEILENQSNVIQQYQDMGIWLVVLLVPFIIILFRKGVLILLLIAFLSNNAYAGLFQRTEQQDYETHMTAIKAFNQKKYDQALKGFSSLSDKDTEALYNQANALAYSGQTDKAIQTYEQVLSKNPQHEDAAFNLEYLKKQIPPEQSKQSAQQNEPQKNEKEKEKDKEKEQTQQDQQKQPDSSQAQENTEDNNQQQNNPHDSQEQDQEQEQDQNQTPQPKQSVSDQLEQDEQPGKKDQTDQSEYELQNIPQEEQQKKEWLDRINSDAGRVLRYRLYQQYGAQQ